MVEFPALPPYPVSAFSVPVPVPGVDPDTGDFFSVCFNTAWLPYVIGCLKLLQSEATWDVSSSTDMAVVLQQSDTLLSLFSEGCSVIQTGVIQLFAGVTAPDGWLLCDGAAVDRTTYSVLFTLIGANYGPGDGSTTFNLPDLRGRVPVGAGSGPGLTARALAESGGEEAHVLSVSELAAHTHVDNGHSHSEGTATASLINGGLEAPASSAVPSLGTTGAGFANLSDSGSDDAHNNMQPFLALNFIIKF